MMASEILPKRRLYNGVKSIRSTSNTRERTLKGAKCSRYQFECRSTRECIAIYNACDGIPQCADGSDEAPELGCPGAVTTQSSPRIHHNKPTYEDSSQNSNGPILSQQYPNVVESHKLYQLSNQQDGAQSSISQRQESDFVRPGDSRNRFIPHNSPYAHDSSHSSLYPQIASQGQWIGQQPNQISSQYSQYEDKNSHIFNHKENGLRVSDEQDISQTPYGESGSQENPKLINYIGDMYRQNPQYQEKWSKNSQDVHYANGNQYIPEINQSGREAWQQQPSPQDVNDREQYYNHPPPSKPETVWKPKKQTTEHHDHEKVAHELKHSKELMENVDKKQIKIETVQKHENHNHVQYAKVTQYKVAEVLDLQDGIAQTPSGAVLSLTLGLIITGVMALLIGCRLRMVRRRIIRGGKSYAHDADYLVNGMYL